MRASGGRGLHDVADLIDHEEDREPDHEGVHGRRRETADDQHDRHDEHRGHEMREEGRRQGVEPRGEAEREDERHRGGKLEYPLGFAQVVALLGAGLRAPAERAQTQSEGDEERELEGQHMRLLTRVLGDAAKAHPEGLRMVLLQLLEDGSAHAGSSRSAGD